MHMEVTQKELERRRKISIARKKQWQNPKYRAKMEKIQTKLGYRHYPIRNINDEQS